MDAEFVKAREKIYQLYSHLHLCDSVFMEVYKLELFRFQYKYNTIYQKYCKNLGVFDYDVTSSSQIPFLPIIAFKNYAIKTGTFEAEIIFSSSGTTGSTRSHHHVNSVSFYLENAGRIWNSRFNGMSQYCFLALLPGYVEREDASLICMVNHFMSESTQKGNGFYLNSYKALFDQLAMAKRDHIPTVLFGVTHALLDFCQHYRFNFENLIVIETGGMKGQKKEITKFQMHEILKNVIGTDNIYSEYGMTELLSQAYTSEGTKFDSNPYFHVMIKQLHDPLSNEKVGKPGVVCVMDLANIDSCAFIQTEDLGTFYANGQFEILGRLDQSDVRGCNLLVLDG
jgi:hypothetical protein